MAVKGNLIGANRLLHVFGGEIIAYERVISREFSTLCSLSESPNPSASLIHDSVRVILGEASYVSLIFFPGDKARGPTKARAEFLRDEFGVCSKSLLSQRILRNHLAHLDERLDKWAKSSNKKNFGRGMLGTRADAIRHGLEEADILGLFDPKRFEFAFSGDDINICDLVGEVREISHRVMRKLRDLPWEDKVQ